MSVQVLLCDLGYWNLRWVPTLGSNGGSGWLRKGAKDRILVRYVDRGVVQVIKVQHSLQMGSRETEVRPSMLIG
jgi:hypothetical protein